MRRLAPIALALLACPLTIWSAGSGYREVPNWPSGGGQAPEFLAHKVSGVSVDRQGNVYVFQRAKDPLLVFDSKGHFLRSWGRGLFRTPHGVRIDPEGAVWLTDVDSMLVMKFTPDGTLLRSWGVRDHEGVDDRHFNGPADVAFGPGGDVYIADGYGNSRVVHLAPNGDFAGSWGKYGRDAGEFHLPHSIACDVQGRVYVADRENRRIQVFTGGGQLLGKWKTDDRPFGLDISGDQKLYVALGTSGAVAVYTLNGKRLKVLHPRRMSVAHLLCTDAHGDLYIADLDGRRVCKMVPR